MSELIQRLRNYDRTNAADSMNEAADRIEVLEAHIKDLEAALLTIVEQIEKLREQEQDK